MFIVWPLKINRNGRSSRKNQLEKLGRRAWLGGDSTFRVFIEHGVVRILFFLCIPSVYLAEMMIKGR